MSKYFELVNPTKKNGVKFYQIKATKALYFEGLDILVGVDELGGWVTEGSQISGDSWIESDVMVWGSGTMIR